VALNSIRRILQTLKTGGACSRFTFVSPTDTGPTVRLYRTLPGHNDRAVTHYCAGPPRPVLGLRLPTSPWVAPSRHASSSNSFSSRRSTLAIRTRTSG
jgi:hypothetical protein